MWDEEEEPGVSGIVIRGCGALRALMDSETKGIHLHT